MVPPDDARLLPFIPPEHSGLGLSFEFFAPKNEQGETALWAALERLARLSPAFATVTYGAGGSTRTRTQDIAARIQARGLNTAAHLTCVGATRDEIDAIARGYLAAGIRHIVALRGDAPKGAARYEPHPDGYAYAADLVAGLKRVADFEISVAGYPETHPEATSPAADLDNLKRKVDNGADRILTQFFMTPDVFLRFRDKVADAGIDVPVVAGILPMGNFARAAEFCAKCGASIPKWMHDIFEGLDDHPETRDAVAIATAAGLCVALHDAGQRDFHFYTMNRADLTAGVCHMLGVR